MTLLRTAAITLSAGLIAVGLPAGGAAYAQYAQPQSSAPQGPPMTLDHPDRASPDTPEIPEKKLDAAAAAIDRVSSIRVSYQEQLAAAPPSDRARITTEANKALKQAIKDQGLSVDEYNSIVDRAQTDPVVRDKLLQRLGAPAQP